MKKRQKIRKGIILISFFLFPAVFYYLSPVLIVDATINKVINGSFISFTLMFISSLFIGRAYCGWVCPGAGCQEAIFNARDKKISRGNFVKWLLWTPWIGTICFLAIKNGGYEKVDFFYQTKYGLSISSSESFITYMLVLLILIVIPSFIFGRRSFCHHFCWMAPFMILGRKIRNIIRIPSLRLRADSEKCTNCHLCSKNCPMSLEVEEMVAKGGMENSECILCGSCVDSCGFDAVRFAFFSDSIRK